MTDIMAGIGLAQLKRYPEMLHRRREIIGRYDEALKNSNVQVLNHYDPDHSSSGHLYIVRLLDMDVAERNEVIVKMAEHGIACNVHYKPLPMMTAYKALGFDITNYPNAYNQYRNEVTLPLHTRLTNEDVEFVISNLSISFPDKVMYKHFFKRLFDLIIALFALPFVLLLILIMVPLIWLTDRGPTFYNAQRVGLNGKIFKMFKFRSMKVNAPDIRNTDGSTFNSSDDPRVTRIGRFIRKTSIDEIPQILNVLIGDMSLSVPALYYRAYLMPNTMTFGANA